MMKARSTYQIMQDMKAAQQAEDEKFKGDNLHPDTLKLVFEMQTPKVPCTFCRTITKNDIHIDYKGGISVFTKYVCPNCKHEFFEWDLHNANKDT